MVAAIMCTIKGGSNESLTRFYTRLSSRNVNWYSFSGTYLTTAERNYGYTALISCEINIKLFDKSVSS
jgi:hypothetical protein